MSCSDIFLGLIAILFPPIAVWIKTGLCSGDSCINILLCLLGYIPGLIHAWYVIAKYPEHDYDLVEDVEGQGRVTYYYISHDPSGRRGGRRQRGQQPQNYGTVPAVPGNKPASQPQQYLPSSHAHSLPPQQVGVTRADSAAPSGSRPAPSSSSNEQAAPPPPYSEVVQGDNKIQRQD